MPFRPIRRIFAVVFLLAFFYVAIAAVPQPLFAHDLEYRNFHVWSDREIDPYITVVLDDADRRLAGSPLFSPDQRFRVFICNSAWRLWFYSQQFDAKLGGATDTWLTRNIYIRAADIAHNRIDSPGPEPILDPETRPLSYYVAHEATHVMESRRFGRLVSLNDPSWLVEGYADYVGKGGDFDFAANRALLKQGDWRLDYDASGLYRRYHLEVALLIDHEGWKIDQIFANPPREADLLELLNSDHPL